MCDAMVLLGGAAAVAVSAAVYFVYRGMVALDRANAARDASIRRLSALREQYNDGYPLPGRIRWISREEAEAMFPAPELDPSVRERCNV